MYGPLYGSLYAPRTVDHDILMLTHDAVNIVTRTYVERLARERQAEATRFQQE